LTLKDRPSPSDKLYSLSLGFDDFTSVLVRGLVILAIYQLFLGNPYELVTLALFLCRGVTISVTLDVGFYKTLQVVNGCGLLLHVPF
jgi:hypothetical protein